MNPAPKSRGLRRTLRARLSRATTLLGTLAFCLPAFAADAPVFLGKLQNFTVSPEFYPPPNERQMKFQLRAAEAQPLTNNLFLITGVRLETFKPNGDRELTLASPGCLYNSSAKTVSSTNAIDVATADGKFAIQGTGFFWQQTNSVLVVSNQVRTTVDAAMMQQDKPAAPQERSQVFIAADSFDYSAQTGLGRYSGNVLVTSTNLTMASHELTFDMPFRERQMRQVDAIGAVRMHRGNVVATGDKATYDVTRGLARVTGWPAWRTPDHQGSADIITIHRLESQVEATGNARLRMAGRSIANSPFTPGATPADASTNRFIDVQSGAYRFWTNRAEFTTDVRVRDEVDGRLRSTLSSDQLHLTFAGKQSLQDLTATGQVLIRQFPPTNAPGDPVPLAEFAADKAAYSTTNNLLELTGKPRWTSTGRHGSGDLIHIHAADEEMAVLGSAQMTLPAAELSSLQIPGSSPETALKPTPGASPATNAVIQSRDYRLNKNGAVFEGGVTIQHPQLTWTCRTLSVALPAKGGKLQRMLAEDDVRFNLQAQPGQTITGEGQRAVYAFHVTPAGTNDLLELTGNPVLTTTNGVFRGNVILLDVTNQRLVAPENYRISAIETLSETNVLRLPRNRIFR